MYKKNFSGEILQKSSVYKTYDGDSNMHFPHSMECKVVLTCRGSTNKVGASTDGVTGEAGDSSRGPEKE